MVKKSTSSLAIPGGLVRLRLHDLMANLSLSPVVMTGPYGVWDLTTGKEIRKLIDHSDKVKSSTVGQMAGKPIALFGSDDGTVRVLDLVTGKEIKKLIGHTGAVESVAVAQLNGKPIAVSGGADGTVRIWSLGPL